MSDLYPGGPASEPGPESANPAVTSDALTSDAAGEGPSTPTGGEAAVTKRAHSRRRRKRGPRKHWIKRTWLRRSVIGLATVVILVAAVAVSGYAYLDHEFHRAHFVSVPHLQTTITSGPHANAETILLIGSTSRCGLNGQQAVQFGTCSSTGPAGAATNVTGVNSDIIMLLHVDPNTHRVSILSIPRDLVLYNVRDTNFHKIDAGLSAGPDVLVQAIENDFGIPINHFVELNFDTFQQVVNTLGSVPVYFPDRVYDNMSGLNITTPGCHLLNGAGALELVRARHLNYWVNGVKQYDGSGDLGRIVRTHEFLRLLAAQVQKEGIGNPIRDNALLGEVMPDLTLDSTFTLGDMVNLVLTFHGISVNKAPQTTLPNVEYYSNYIYEGYNYGSVVLPSYPADQTAIDQWLGLNAPPAATVAPGSFTVNVLDGTGNQSSATQTAAKLTAQGYRVVGSSGSWPSVGPLSETVVEYSPGHLADAERVMESLSGIVSMAQAPVVPPSGSDLPASTGADVTVITGTNFSVVVPPSYSTTPTHSGASTTTTSGTGGSGATTTTTSGTGGSGTGGSGGSGVISSGSSSVDSLLSPTSASQDPTPPYDPRACPPNSPIIP